MKPRLRMVRGYWQCGMLAGPNYCWAVAPTWSEAYALWARVFQRGTAASQER